MSLIIRFITIFLMISCCFCGNYNSIFDPKQVMDCMLKCREDETHGTLASSNKEKLNSFENLPIVGPEHLEAMLRSALNDDDVSDYVMERIEQELGASKGTFRPSADRPPTTNIVNIDVPPSEMQAFHDRMERVMKQNNNLLLEGIHYLIRNKFSDVEQRLLKQINSNANILSLQISNEVHLLKQMISNEASASSSVLEFENFLKTKSEINHHKTVQPASNSSSKNVSLRHENSDFSTEPSTMAVRNLSNEEPATGQPPLDGEFSSADLKPTKADHDVQRKNHRVTTISDIETIHGEEINVQNRSNQSSNVDALNLGEGSNLTALVSGTFV